jgi:integrase
MLRIFTGGDMARPPNPIPKYTLHSSGRARIYFNSVYKYLPGDYNSPESRQAFYEMCEIIHATGDWPVEVVPEKPLTVMELGIRYLAFCVTYYGQKKNGRTEAVNLRYAVDSLTDLYGSRLAGEFGPPQLKAVRKSLIKKGHVRRSVNKRATQIIACYKWAVEEGLVEPDVWQRLSAVKPIAPGREGAIDNPAVEPVTSSQYELALPYLPAGVKIAIQVQRLTGMRSKELLSMCPQDCDMSREHWIYRLEKHKTEKHIGVAYVLIPAPAVELLQACMPKTFCDRWFPWSVGHQQKSVARACLSAGVPHWYPHQLRHNLATEINEKLNIEAAQKVLRHTDPRMTRRYSKETVEGLLSVADQLYPDVNLGGGGGVELS